MDEVSWPCARHDGLKTPVMVASDSAITAKASPRRKNRIPNGHNIVLLARKIQFRWKFGTYFGERSTNKAAENLRTNDCSCIGWRVQRESLKLHSFREYCAVGSTIPNEVRKLVASYNRQRSRCRRRPNAKVRLCETLVASGFFERNCVVAISKTQIS
jgi:hypothetical protein